MQQLIIHTLSKYLNILAHIAPKKAGEVGFKLFCKPFRLKINNKQMAFFNTADQSSIQHEKDIIKIYRWGSGPKNILFLHGWRSHTYRWKAYIESLDQDKYTIYAFDAPGHGLSTGNFMSVPLYSEVIERILKLIGPIDTVVGHSIGGFTALYTFFRHPGLKAQKLVLMAPPGEATQFFEFYQQTLKLSDKFIDHTVKHFTQTFNHCPAYFSASKFASGLTIPGLIIHDEDDGETSIENAIDINKAWLTSQLVITKGAGHNLKSPQVLRQVIDFVNQPIEADTELV